VFRRAVKASTAQPHTAMTTTHSEDDISLAKGFVSLVHDRAVGGAVNSDDSDDDRAITALCVEKDSDADTL
jgi:hypothetical protein